MKGILKGIIIGIVFIAIGAGITVAALAANDWKFKGPKYEMQTYTAEQDNGTLDIDVGACTLKTEFYDGDRIEILYPVRKGHSSSVSENGGGLKFETDIKWYASLFNWSDPPETVIKLPAGKVFNLKIDVGAGKVDIAGGTYGSVQIDVSAGSVFAEGVKCDMLDADVSAGKLELRGLDCPDIKADVSAGRLEINVDGVKSEYSISASVSAGSCNVSNQTGSTAKKIHVDCSAGSVNVSFGN